MGLKRRVVNCNTLEQVIEFRSGFKSEIEIRFTGADTGRCFFLDAPEPSVLH